MKTYPPLAKLAVLSAILLPVLCAGCTRVDDHEGGLFAPFEGGVVSQSGSNVTAPPEGGGKMDLPPASDFVSDEDLQGLSDEPLVRDTGGPPAVLASGDDDSAAMGTAFGEGDADASTTGPTPDPGSPVLPAAPDVTSPVAVATPPDPALTAQVHSAQIPVEAWRPAAPPAVIPSVQQPASEGVQTTGCNPEAALVYSTPLSEIALVASIPEAAPPRAIVRFPGGLERVVQVGDLLGDNGAKVVFIGSGHIKLAEVTVVAPDHPDIDTHYLHLTR